MDVAPSRREAFLSLREGEEDPVLGKLVDTLIARHDEYIVYLDDELYVWWACDTASTESEGSAEVLNRVSWLEAKPIYMSKEDQRRTYRRMLGEGVARMLAGRVKE